MVVVTEPADTAVQVTIGSGSKYSFLKSIIIEARGSSVAVGLGACFDVVDA